MSETPANSNESSAQAAPQRPGLSDERLMLAFTQGSSEAFTELFHRYKQLIYGFFYRRLADPSKAEELTQETFFALLRGAARYEPRATFRTYLYGIAMRMVMAERRKFARRASSLPVEPSHSSDPCVDAAIWVRRAIQQLDAEHRDILLLREYEQLTYDEIAALLHLPVNTVRSRLFRARTALKAFLLPLRPEMRNET